MMANMSNRVTVGNRGRSTTGERAVPEHYPTTPDRETAAYLRLTASRYLSGKANRAEVDQAHMMFEQTADARSPHIEAARRLRAVVASYIAGRASLEDVDRARVDLVGVAPVAGERGYRKSRDKECRTCMGAGRIRDEENGQSYRKCLNCGGAGVE